MTFQTQSQPQHTGTIRPRSRKLTATLLTITFGSIPATFISFLPAMALAMSVAALFSRQQASELPQMLLFLLWGFSGVYGTVALWLTPFFPRFAFVRAGLVFGLLAIAPVTTAILVQLDFADISRLKLDWESAARVGFGVGFVTVPVVAISWLYHFARTKWRIAL